MSSPEEKAYEIMRELDVNYVLVIFGGLTGYSSDGEYFKQNFTYEPVHEKTNNLGHNQVRHKQGCTVTEDG